MDRSIRQDMKVEWYSGYTLYDSPRRILWAGQWLEVISILQRANTPNGAFFKILASNRAVYLLRHSLCQNFWNIIPIL